MQPPSNENNLDALISQAKKNKKDWKILKDIFSNVRKKEKYQDLISQGIFSTTLEAQDNGDDVKKTIRYVVKNTNSIPDSDIKFKESDLIKYYSNHKYDAKYQEQNAFREIKYFSLSDAPSGKDSIEFYDFFDNVRSDFVNAENDYLTRTPRVILVVDKIFQLGFTILRIQYIQKTILWLVKALHQQLY